jgi:divalent metal cation (Fe/Co/Zn/Cd) transporter
MSEVRKEALHRRALLLEWFTVFWNVIEAGVAIGAGVIAGSSALVAFGADSLIEVTSAVGLLWRLYRARAGASAEDHNAAERKALYVVAATFFALAVHTAYESILALLNRETPEISMVGLVLSVLSLIIMPVLAYTKQRTGQQMGSGALQADAAETWVCSYLSLALLARVGLHAAFG